MTIALISDIHANLPALEACLADIDNRAIDTVFCLGDLVGYNIWPNEVIAEIRKRNIPTIAGNYDFGIGRASDECGCAYKTEDDKAMGKISIAYTNETIGAEERKYLRSLPAHIRLEYQLNDTPMNLVLVHGSPRKINEYLFEDRAAISMLRILQLSDADILCFGHTHIPYHRVIRDEHSGRYHHAINTGSVGKPKDGDPRGCYVLLTIDEQSKNSKPDSIAVEFVRFEYDIERAATGIEQSPLPNAYADMLRKGG